MARCGRSTAAASASNARRSAITTPPKCRPASGPRRRRSKRVANGDANSSVGHCERGAAKRKADLVAAYGGRCIDCGYSTCPEALQFHHRDPSTKDFGLGHFSGSLARLARRPPNATWCVRNCHRIRTRTRDVSVALQDGRTARDTKRRAIELFGGACLACGSAHAPAALEFHHPDPSKKEFAISVDGIYRSWEKVQRELENCVMLCANCHAEIHAGVRVLDLAVHPALERPTVVAS